MTANQYRAAIARLGLTRREAARLLGVDEGTCGRWARHGVTGTAKILLRLLDLGTITPEDVENARG